MKKILLLCAVLALSACSLNGGFGVNGGSNGTGIGLGLGTGISF